MNTIHMIHTTTLFNVNILVLYFRIVFSGKYRENGHFDPSVVSSNDICHLKDNNNNLI